MKRIIAGTIFVMCVFTIAGWGQASGEKDNKHTAHLSGKDRVHQDAVDRGEDHADRERQEKDEDIKRAQGDEIGRRDVHNQGPLQDDDRGRW